MLNFQIEAYKSVFAVTKKRMAEGMKFIAHDPKVLSTSVSKKLAGKAKLNLSSFYIRTFITDSVKMSEKKDILEKLHKRMIQEVQDYAIILLDADGTILTWNVGAEKIKGYKEEEILGQNFNIFYLPQDREEQLPQKLIALAKKEGRAKHIGRRLKKDGKIFWGSIVITALHDDNGDVIGFTKLTEELRDGEIK